MNQPLKVTIKSEGAEKALSDTAKKAKDPRIPFARIHREMVVRISGPRGLFEQLRTGGTHRGVTWNYFKAQYTRQSDGATVPAWGGVPKVRGRGMVKGRRRPSGRRVSQGDAIMQDTMNLRRSALMAVRITPTRLVMGTPVNYAAAVSKHHPFAFFDVPDDVSMMQRTFIEYFNA